MKDKEKPEPPKVGPADLSIRREADGGLALLPPGGGEPLAGVRVARCFPWTRPDSYISVRDEAGREISLVPDLGELTPDTRREIEAELVAQEFIPRIVAVHDVEDRFDVMIWNVETDRGPVELQVKNAEDVHQLDDGRVVVRDHAGGTFVATPSELDPRSRRILDERCG
ncbi:MAG: DUF1854 domain-containing protein [Lentisphaerae bacterium]|nr:DUF1854 domain-containing protein [Lentisphaerota bacterium]